MAIQVSGVGDSTALRRFRNNPPDIPVKTRSPVVEISKDPHGKFPTESMNLVLPLGRKKSTHARFLYFLKGRGGSIRRPVGDPRIGPSIGDSSETGSLGNGVFAARCPS